MSCEDGETGRTKEQEIVRRWKEERDPNIKRQTSRREGHVALVCERLAQPAQQAQLKQARTYAAIQPANWGSDGQGRGRARQEQEREWRAAHSLYRLFLMIKELREPQKESLSIDWVDGELCKGCHSLSPSLRLHHSFTSGLTLGSASTHTFILNLYRLFIISYSTHSTPKG